MLVAWRRGWMHGASISNATWGSHDCVIGSGLDVTYPHQHRLLQEQLAQQQLLITEYPLQTPPKAQHFPARNRIIAGLCSTCLVVEGKQKKWKFNYRQSGFARKSECDCSARGY